MTRHLFTIAAALLFCLSAAAAQTPEALLNGEKAKRALDFIRSVEAETIAEQIKTCEIPAPPFKEQQRAAYYKQRFTEFGLKNVRIDREGSVIGERPGTESGRTLAIVAHLDTVFPEGTDVRVRREGPILIGPGIGDNCRGLAVILSVARALDEARIETKATVVFVANVGEEGLGNLRGTRHLLTEEMPGRITDLLGIDAQGFDVVEREIGSNRYRVTFSGPGGHSFIDFGRPSAIHALGRAIEKISLLRPPASPKTTFNVGRIEGGTTVNSIAQTASMEVDLRSVSGDELAKIDGDFRRAVADALNEENAGRSGSSLSVDIKLIGERPVGRQSPDAPIIRTVLASDRALGIKSNLTASSTDSGMPNKLGIPAVTIGSGGRWLGSHSVTESFDMTDSYRGSQRVLAAVLSIAGIK
ncbi:MAG: M20/M25/M40 family metallo-hydrolase [Pyrinomonadaceae bacterium]|nr:M20/M25/M40 family metallo-hydrolase [Pyrinomonadaceae bacterium]